MNAESQAQRPSIRLSDIVRLVGSRRALVSCLLTAAIVGTLISLINQGSVILDGRATSMTWLRVLMNYLIPFVVSNIGFISGSLRPHNADLQATDGGNEGQETEQSGRTS